MSQAGKDAAAGLAEVPPKFSLMQSGAEAVRTSFGDMVAGFTAAGVVTNIVTSLGAALADAAKDAQRLPAVSRSFDQLTKSVGETNDAMLMAAKQGTKGLVTDLDLMLATNKAILLGLPVTAKEMGELSETALVLGQAMGSDATTAMNDLITALGRSSPLILDNLGLTVKAGEANEKYAAQLGKSASELTETEQKTAFYNAAMEAAEEKVTELGGAHLTLMDQLARLGVAMKNHATGFFASKNEASVLSSAIGALADNYERLVRAAGSLLTGGLGDFAATAEQISKSIPKVKSPPPIVKPGTDPGVVNLSAGTLTKDIERLEKESEKLGKTIEKKLNPQLLTTTQHMKDWTFHTVRLGMELPKAIENQNAGLQQFLIPSLSQVSMFMTALPGQVTSFNSSVEAAAIAQEQAARRTEEWHEKVIDLGAAFLDLGFQVGGTLGDVLTGIGGMIQGVSIARESVGRLRDGFKLLGSGSILSGLTSIVGGIGGIVQAAQAAVAMIKSLWMGLKMLFGGGEEGVIVNPWRDKFFKQFQDRYGLGPYESLVAAFNDAIAGGLKMDGNQISALIKALYDSKNMKDAEFAAQNILDALAEGGVRWPKLPPLAKGGIAMKPTWRLFGEAGPEAVIPLHRLKDVMGGLHLRDSQVAGKLDRLIGLQELVLREFKMQPTMVAAAVMGRG
jgi:hypothetical protein